MNDRADILRDEDLLLYAVGEADAKLAKQVESLMAADASVKARVEQMRSLDASLKTAASSVSPHISPAESMHRAQVVLRRAVAAHHVSPAAADLGVPAWLRWSAVAAIVTVGALVMISRIEPTDFGLSATPINPTVASTEIPEALARDIAEAAEAYSVFDLFDRSDRAPGSDELAMLTPMDQTDILEYLRQELSQ